MNKEQIDLIAGGDCPYRLCSGSGWYEDEDRNEHECPCYRDILDWRQKLYDQCNGSDKLD